MTQKAREVVYITRRQHVKKLYHTNEDCENIADNYRSVEKHKVDAIYDLCAVCNPEKLVRQTSPDEPKECPYCGESFGRLPVHLPKCEET